MVFPDGCSTTSMLFFENANTSKIGTLIIVYCNYIYNMLADKQCAAERCCRGARAHTAAHSRTQTGETHLTAPQHFHP